MDFNSSRKQQMTRNDSLFTSTDDASSCTSEVVATLSYYCMPDPAWGGESGDCSFTHSDRYNCSNELDNLAHLSD